MVYRLPPQSPHFSLIPDMAAESRTSTSAFETTVHQPGCPPLGADLWRCPSPLSPEVLAPAGFCCLCFPRLATSSASLKTSPAFPSGVRSLSLRPSWVLASWADQTEPRLSLSQASTSGLPAPKSSCGLPDMTTAPHGELCRQDLHLQVQQLVSLRPLPEGLVRGGRSDHDHVSFHEDR